MTGTVPMKALRSWRNVQFEGTVTIDDEFDAANEWRARELEFVGLAVRRAALSGKTVKVEAYATPASPPEIAVPQLPLADRQPGARRHR